MEQLWSTKVVLITGKGGVGRTVFVAALARAAARHGRRALVVDLEDGSSERRSSLARLYGRDGLPREPVAVEERVDAVLAQTEYGAELFLRAIFPARPLAGLALRSRSLQRLLYAAPSFREMGLLFHLLHLVDGEPHRPSPYDLVIVDLPATGHVLAMTGLPEILLRLVPVGPVAEAFRRGVALFGDPRRTAAWVVTLPEQLPVTETLELIEGLRRTGTPVGGIIVNRMPQAVLTSAERAALVCFLAGKRVRGLVELGRADRAVAACARLRQEPELRQFELPEVTGGEGEVVRRLADLITAGRPGQVVE